MNVSQLPHTQDIPGRQAVIDHAAAIDQTSFKVVNCILFGMAILCVSVRFAIRIFGRRKIGWDDGLVLVAFMALIAAFVVCHKFVTMLYLMAALRNEAVIVFQEELLEIKDVLKWANIFGAMNFTAVYMVKFAFLNFFYPLIQGMSLRITRFYWATVGISIVCWLYTVLNVIIVCPRFGADSAKCPESRSYHIRSTVNNLLIAIIDIATDALIVALPIVVLKQSMMSFARKLSAAALLCLSFAMMACTLARLVCTIIDTNPDASGSAPVWGAFWIMVESSVSLIMTAVIAIRNVFIAQVIQDNGQTRDCIMKKFSRRLLSTLRLSSSSKNSGRRSPGWPTEHEQNAGSGVPGIATVGVTRVTLSGVRKFIGGVNTRRNNEETLLESVDTAYILESMDYHKIQRDGVRQLATLGDGMQSEMRRSYQINGR